MYSGKNNPQDEENSISVLDEAEPSLWKTIYLEGISIIEAEDDQNLPFSDGIVHIEDL